MRVALLTREYPPDVYGGAGVHVEYLARELAALEDVTVHKWASAAARSRSRRTRGPAVVDHAAWDALAGPAPHLAALRAVSIDLTMAAGAEGADVVHSHTWYANLAGHLAKLMYGIPHVATRAQPRAAAALEGRAARGRLRGVEVLRADGASSTPTPSSPCRRACARTSSPAIRRPTRSASGSSTTASTATSTRRTAARTCWSASASIPRRPSVVFVGRITRQKGVEHLLEAARSLRSRARSSSCAPARRTRPSWAPRSRAGWSELREQRDGVLWIAEMLPKPQVIQLLSHATVFACPSIYEPLGIVNLEAMACEAAVVATATGGIVEVVVDGETGLLVPFEPSDDGLRTPRRPAGLRGRHRVSG